MQERWAQAGLKLRKRRATLGDLPLGVTPPIIYEQPKASEAPTEMVAVETKLFSLEK